MKKLLQVAPGEAGEGGSSLCFTFLPAWPMEPSSEGDPLGAELCRPGGRMMQVRGNLLSSCLFFVVLTDLFIFSFTALL